MATNTGIGKGVDIRERAGVGRGMTKDLANAMRREVQEETTAPLYKREGIAEYPFEALDSKTIQATVRPVVDAWVEVRAQSHYSRTLFFDTESIG